MLEYVFFHLTPFELFVSFLKEHKLKVQTEEQDGVFEINIPDDLNPSLAEKVETEYD